MADDTDQMTEDEARAAGYIPAHEADPDVMTPEEATAAGYSPPPSSQSSVGGMMLRKAISGVVPTVASLPGAAAGAEIGAGIGTAVFPGPGTVAGGIIGGLGGAILGGMAGSAAQDVVSSNLGLSNPNQEAADEAVAKQHPYLATAAELAPAALAFSPGRGLQVASRAAGAGIFGGMEAGQELYNEGTVDPGRLAEAAGMGAIANKPTKYGQVLLDLGGRPAKAGIAIARSLAAGGRPPSTGAASPPAEAGQPGRPDIDTAPETAQTKQDAIASEPQKVSRGVAAVQPPPSNIPKEPATLAVEGSDQLYPKENVPPKNAVSSATFGDLDPGTTEALRTRLLKDREPLPPPPPKPAAGLDVSQLPATEGAPATPVPAEPAAAPVGKVEAPVATPEARAVEQSPQVQADLANTKVDRTHDVPYGAGKLTDGGIAIDRHIPETAEINGKTFDTAEFVKLHEDTEYEEMQKKIQEWQAANPGKDIPQEIIGRIYENAHNDVATPAEKAAVEAKLGPDAWKPYQELWKSWLSNIEHEKPANPPPTLYGIEYPAAQRLIMESRGDVGAVLPGEAPIAVQKLKQVTAPVTTPERLKVAGLETAPVASGEVDARLKSRAVAAAQTALEAHPPMPDQVPTKVVDRKAFKAQLQEAIAHATEANEGENPFKYKPREMPPAMQWLRDARRVINGKMPIQEFMANDKLLRSGSAELVRQGNRVEGDIAKNRRAGEAVINLAETQQAQRGEFPGEVPHEEAETMVKPEPVDIAEIIHGIVGEGKELDLTKLTPEREAALMEKMTPEQFNNFTDAVTAKLTENVIRTVDKPKTPEPTKPSEGAASEVRRVPFNEAAQKTALAMLDKAANKLSPEARAETYVKPRPGQKDGSGKVPEMKDLVKDFFNSEDGTLNSARIRNDLKTKGKAITAAMKNEMGRWFGHTFTNEGLIAEAKAASSAARHDQLMNSLGNFGDRPGYMTSDQVHILDARWWHFIDNAKPSEQMTYQRVLEDQSLKDRAAFKQGLIDKGIPADKADWMADEMPYHREMMKRVWDHEIAHGMEPDFIENYVSHIFDGTKKINGQNAEQWMEAYRKTLGPRWFEKERTFDLIEKAEQAGFKLKYANPIDVIAHRMRASYAATRAVDLLRDFQKSELAAPSDEATPYQKNNWGKTSHTADGKQWYIAPETHWIWNNQVEMKGLSDSQGRLGSIYRTFMATKAVTIPIKLAVSAFHFLHVIHLDYNDNIARGIYKGSIKDLGSEVVKHWKDPIFALPLERWMPQSKEFIGKKVQDESNIPFENQTKDQQLRSMLMEKMGISAKRNEQERIADAKRIKEAWDNNQFLKLAPSAVQQAVRMSTGWMFDKWIPRLKINSAFNMAAAAIQKYPELLNHPNDFTVAMRAVGKQVDDRYGEMFYNALPWNKFTKDVSVGSMLSLGWNLGIVRQAGGAVSNLVTGRAFGKGTRQQQVVYNATNKGAYVGSYVATSMAVAGLVSWAMSGVFPKGMDYIFPQSGNKNPDGTPGRMTTMFNTRDLEMARAHIQEKGSVIQGLGKLLWNKMILSPITDALSNRDFFGRQLYDTNAPWWKATAQLVSHMTEENFNPIVASGYQRYKQQGGGGPADLAKSFLGFGPAPAYANRSGVENRMVELYREHATPETHPYNPEKDKAVQDARTAFNQAQRSGDKEGMRLARKAESEAGAGNKAVANLGTNALPRMFAKLPIEDKSALVKSMNADEFSKYVLENPEMKSYKKDAYQLMKERGLLPR